MKQIPRQAANGHIQNPTREQIAAAAFHLYVENGCQDGRDLDDWLRAEKLLTQKAAEVAQIPIFEPSRKAVSRAVEIRPVGSRERPLARDERGSASREEIRQKTTQLRPGSRQPRWRIERSAESKRAA